MRTNIEIDDDLIERAIMVSGAKTKREVVHEGLEALILRHQRLAILQLRGIGWEGDLDAMRTDIDE